MKLRAKFICNSIVNTTNTKGEVEVVTANFSAVYSPDPTQENYSWSKWTPCGSLSMTVTNPAAFNEFEQGKEYFLDLERILSGSTIQQA